MSDENPSKQQKIKKIPKSWAEAAEYYSIFTHNYICHEMSKFNLHKIYRHAWKNFKGFGVYRVKCQ